MPIGRLNLGSLGRMGGGLGSVQSRHQSSAPPVPPTINALVKEDSDGFNNFILTENNETIDDTE